METTTENQTINWFNRGTQVWQMLASMGAAFLFAVTVVVNATNRQTIMEKDGQRRDEKIELLETQLKELNSKLETKLDQIITTTNQIQLDLKDKEDRK